MANPEAIRVYLGWAVDRPGHPLYVQYGGDEDQAWMIALGWPPPEEIAAYKADGARAFPIEIREVINAKR